MPYWNHMDVWGGWSGGIHLILMAIFWGVVIYLVLLLLNRYKSQPGGTLDSPLEIARRRYANGEISKEEFEKLKRNLQS